MFSSLASYLFGTNSENPENPSEVQNKPNEQEQQVEGEQQQQQQREGLTGDVIEVTARTPSVTGGNRKGGKRGGKNRRGGGGAKQKQAGGVGNAQTRKNSPTITKLLTPSGDNCDEDFDEDEWFIVEKEDEETSLPRTDSEEDEISIVELQQQQLQRAGAPTASVGGATRRRQHINSHSLYSGPRPQQQRNYLQRSRNAARGPLSISTLSPPRSVPGGLPEQQLQLQQQQRSADNGITQSLYAAPAISPIGSDQESGASAGSGHGGYGANMSMEESWYVTPPPCFTSIGPINMETSPFENLLIEHPSMSVYHSIRSAQEATDSFVNLDLGVNNEAQQQQQQQQQQQRQALEQQKPPAPAAERRAPTQSQSQSTALHERNTNASRIDRQAAAELKQQQLARSSQKSNNKKDHKTLCRGAIKRANQVRDYQSKSNRPRRSDMQHCKLVSGANNNRKCCF